LGHSFEQLIETYRFTSLNPLTSGIDFGVSLNRGDDRCRRDLDFVRLFDDALECRTDICAAPVKKSERMCMAIDGAPVCESVRFGDPSRAPPVYEIFLDLSAVRV